MGGRKLGVLLLSYSSVMFVFYFLNSSWYSSTVLFLLSTDIENMFWFSLKLKCKRAHLMGEWKLFFFEWLLRFLEFKFFLCGITETKSVPMSQDKWCMFWKRFHKQKWLCTLKLLYSISLYHFQFQVFSWKGYQVQP